MNILYITHCDPRRTDFGSAQRSHLMWKALKRLGTVYTIYNIGPDDPKKVFDNTEHIASVSLLSPNPIVKILQVLCVRYLAPAEWPFRSRKFIQSKLPWKNVEFDCVVTRYLRTAAQTAAWKIAPLYVDIDDLPSESFATIRRGAHSTIVGWFLQKIVDAWQRFVLRKCRATWIANGDQVAEVQKICTCSSLPNLAMPPSAGYVRNGRQKQQLMTVGLMGYEPNCQGVDWFLETCWPEIHRHFPEMTYAIAGGGLSNELQAKWSTLPNVQVLGFVDDLDALYSESLAVVTPIRSGAGTCIKVIEAAMHGRKVISTPFAVRGLGTRQLSAIGVVVSDVPEQIIGELEALLRDSRRRIQDEISRNALEMNSYENLKACVNALLAPVAEKR